MKYKMNCYELKKYFNSNEPKKEKKRKVNTWLMDWRCVCVPVMEITCLLATAITAHKKGNSGSEGTKYRQVSLTGDNICRARKTSPFACHSGYVCKEMVSFAL